MATSIQPFGNANSFSGIPWTVPNPAYNANEYAIGGAIGSMAGASAPQPFGQPTIDNPRAAGYAGQVEGIAGQLGQVGANAVGAATSTQSQVGGLASQLQSLGTGLTTAFTGDLGYANKALSDAFDPMKSAYDYYSNQQQNQAAAQAAQSGYGGTPYAGEVMGANRANFDNAWQTAQIGRENTGASTATQLQGQYEQGVLGGGGLIGQAGQLDLGALSGVLQGYGLQGDSLAKAGQLVSALLSSLSESVKAPDGASLTYGNANSSPTGA